MLYPLKFHWVSQLPISIQLDKEPLRNATDFNNPFASWYLTTDRVTFDTGHTASMCSFMAQSVAIASPLSIFSGVINSMNDHSTRELTLAVFTIVVVSQPDPSDVFFSHFALANDQAWLKFGIRTLCIILQSSNSWDNSQCFASMPGSPLLCSVLWADAENCRESSPAFVLAIIWQTTSLFSSAGTHFFASVASFKLTVSHMRCLSGAKHRRNSVVINWLLNYAVKVINK